MLSLTILVLASLIKPSSQTDDCLSVSSSGALFTKEGFVLNGHTRKTISAVSFTQCCLRCVQTDWCVSVNFKTMTRIGECQLNDYGVTSEVEISENGGKFQVKQDAIFSQLRDAKVTKLHISSKLFRYFQSTFLLILRTKFIEIFVKLYPAMTLKTVGLSYDALFQSLNYFTCLANLIVNR